MTFKEFVHILKPIIGGSYSTIAFTRTLFDTIITEDGKLHIEDISPETFKAYYNGNTQITKIAQRVLPFIDVEEFASYLNNFSEATTQRLCDAFSPYIEDIDLYNTSEKIAYFFESILIEAAGTQRKGTPKSAEKSKVKSSSDVLQDKLFASAKAVADVWSNAMDNLVNETETDTHKESVEYIESEVVDDESSGAAKEEQGHTTIIQNQTVIEHDESKTFNIKDINVTFNL